MAKHRERQKVEVVRLGFDFTFVVEVDGRGKPKTHTTAPAGSALVIKGEGRDQEITWMPWDAAMARYEPEDEIGQDDDDVPRVAAARRRDRSYRYDDDRRDGYREPRVYDYPYGLVPPAQPTWRHDQPSQQPFAGPYPPPPAPIAPQRDIYGGAPPAWPMPNADTVAPAQNGAVPKGGNKA